MLSTTGDHRLQERRPECFEQLSKEATTLVIGEDETRQVDLKVLPGSGGQ